jgi:hypothetical protein
MSSLKQKGEDYAPLHSQPETDDGSEGDCEATGLIGAVKKTPSRQRSNRWAILLGVVLLVVSNGVSVFVGGLLGRKTVDLDESCSAYTVQYCACPVLLARSRLLIWSLAPVVSEVDIKYDFKQFNGSFMQENVYRRKGSPEVDAAWEALGVDCKRTAIGFPLD